MFKIPEHPSVRILCDVRCPACESLKRPFETKVIEVSYIGADGVLEGWAIVTNCCNAVLVKCHSFDTVVGVLAISNGESDNLHIRRIIPKPVPIEIIEIKNSVPN